jgi:hypothetical protein
MTPTVEKPDTTMDDKQVEDVELKGVSNNPRAHLVPRPSEDNADPLNWPMKLKILILVQVCWLAFVSFSVVKIIIFSGRLLGHRLTRWVRNNSWGLGTLPSSIQPIVSSPKIFMFLRFKPRIKRMAG